MQTVKIVLTFALCVIMIFVLVGCNILDNLIKDDGGTPPLAQLLDRNRDVLPAAAPSGEQTVNLYFVDKSGRFLIEEKRTIPKTLSIARETVNQWLMGPTTESSDCYAAVNPSTVLLDIGIKNGIATVDLSKEFLQPYSNATAEAALYGLVNTVAQFSTVEIVRLRVEGHELKTYRGIILDNLRFRNDIIRYSSGPVAQGVYETETQDKMPENNTIAGVEKFRSPSSLNLFVN